VGGFATGGGGGGVAQAAVTPEGYLLSAQNRDGGFGPAPGQGSAQLYSGWAALGLAAAGKNPQAVSKGGASLVDYLRAGTGSDSDPGSLERTILAVRAAGLAPTSFGGRDLLAALERGVRSDGSVSEQTNLTAFAVLALRAAGVAPRAGMIGWLVRQQDQDGGFNFATAGGSSDVDDTGAVLEALAGPRGRVSARAVRFVDAQQNGDGGFPSSPGADSNAQSTAWAVQGLLAVGERGKPVTRALAYLNSLVAPDGHVRYSRASDQTPVWVTAEAVMALAGKPLPVAAPPILAPPVGHGTARASTGSRAAAARRTVAERPRRAPVPSAPSQRLTSALATYAGVAAALALAPLGLG
jgi:energy-coupling factor transport system substrate-specific component